MDENRTYEMEEQQTNYYDMPAESDSGLGIVGKVAIGVGLAAIGAGTAWFVATRDKRKAKKAEKAKAELEKAGYVVISPENTVEETEEVLEGEVVEAEK